MCDNGNCYTLATHIMGVNYFNYTAVGGEGLCDATPDGHTGCPIGYIAARQNQFLWWNDNQWYSYCYTQPHNNVASDGGTISTCRGGIDPPDWQVNYK